MTKTDEQTRHYTDIGKFAVAATAAGVCFVLTVLAAPLSYSVLYVSLSNIDAASDTAMTSVSKETTTKVPVCPQARVIGQKNGQTKQ